MEAVYSASVPYIHNLQIALSPYESLLTMISTVLDPRYAFYIYTPLLYALEPKSGRQLLWVSVLAEWSNQILKWLLHGHRPYWYVHVAPDSATLPSLIQYPVSCETGPGSPSGHAMVTAAVFFVLIAFMLDSGKTNRRLRYVAWTGFVALVALVSISRVFLAAHFPHQCALGAVLGLVVVITVRRMSPWLDQLTRNQYLLATVFLGGTALITRQLLPLLGMDGEWSVRLATQHCLHPEWVHLDTSPLFSLMRYTGFLAGFGLGLHSSTARQFNRLHFNTRMRLATAMVSLTLAKCSELIPKPPSSSQLYMLYAYGFILSAGLAFIYTALSPLLVVKCTPKLVYRKTSTIDNC